MKTKVAIIKNLNEDKDFINEAGNIIKSGGTVAFPTETVYGLGADALNGEAVKKIFLAKGRPQDNPLIIHVSSKKIEKFVKDVPPVAEKLMDKFWPGPMTIILNKKDIVPDETSAGLSTIGVRVGIIKDWKAKWYADSKNFADYLVEDQKIRKFLKKKLYAAWKIIT